MKTENRNIGVSSQSWPDLAGRIENDLHILPVRVYYEDTDFTGVVYHATYLRFAERGRSDFLRLSGIHHADWIEADPPLAFAVHKMELEFIKPARIDDVLEVHTRYQHFRGARLDMGQEIVRADEVIWRARVRAACIDLQGRPRRLPESMLKAVTQVVAASPASL